MLKIYHRQILQEALEGKVSPHALEIVIEANLKQDGLRGQIGHDEYHFDNNAFDESYAYIEKNHANVRAALKGGDFEEAWAAFGRLSHTAQDFYAHSNYIALWLAQFDKESVPLPENIDHADQAIIKSDKLKSGKFYYPLELLSYIPALKRYVMPYLPKDSHAWMNIDSPEQGEKFAYAYAAAVKRTENEFERALAGLSEEERDLFLITITSKESTPAKV